MVAELTALQITAFSLAAVIFVVGGFEIVSLAIHELRWRRHRKRRAQFHRDHKNRYIPTGRNR
jgi:hypothetical protein